MKKKEEQLEEMERKREAEAREKEELKKELALWKGRCLEQRPIDGLLSPVHHSTPVKRVRLFYDKLVGEYYLRSFKTRLIFSTSPGNIFG